MDAYNFTQASPSTTWTINHDLNNDMPNIDCQIDVGGTLEKVIPLNTVAEDANTITVTFTSAFAGYARVTA